MSITHTEKCDTCGTVFNKHDGGRWTWALGKKDGHFQECGYCEKKIEGIIQLDKMLGDVIRMN